MEQSNIAHKVRAEEIGSLVGAVAPSEEGLKLVYSCKYTPKQLNTLYEALTRDDYKTAPPNMF